MNKPLKWLQEINSIYLFPNKPSDVPFISRDEVEPDPFEYQEMTWEMFISLRQWAQTVSDKEGYPVFLGGSSLRKVRPRDIDVWVFMPQEELVKRFGAEPEIPYEKYQHALKVFVRTADYYTGGKRALGDNVSFDVRFVSDTSWLVNLDKVMLAYPNPVFGPIFKHLEHLYRFNPQEMKK